MDEKFLTTEQVANILQVHPFTILKLIKDGKLKGIKLGRVYRIPESDVKEFIESRMTGQKKEKIEKKEKKSPKKHYKIEKKEKGDEGEHYHII